MTYIHTLKHLRSSNIKSENMLKGTAAKAALLSLKIKSLKNVKASFAQNPKTPTTKLNTFIHSFMRVQASKRTNERT